MPTSLIRALARVKEAAATVNQAQGDLAEDLAQAIRAAAREVCEGRHDREFPLRVWQTGSGTQTNMNLNEVIANRASELLGGERGTRSAVHPNDHVNMSQSSNDSFPTAMHLAAVEQLEGHLLPSLEHLRELLAARGAEFTELVKIGRTHLQDATPLSLGQEFSGYEEQVRLGVVRLRDTLPRLYALPQGGTAVGTGLNTRTGFDVAVVEQLVALTGHPFRVATSKFEALSAHDAVVECSGALNTVAVSLTKIANDLRLSASGPRCGVGELVLPTNEPGSSIMPGKINPTQCEALTMVCTQVFGNHVTITMAGCSGHWQLNAARSFADRCVAGLQPNRDRIAENLRQSLMLATALTPHLGYDGAALVARAAHERGLSLRAAALELGLASESDLDAWLSPDRMLLPPLEVAPLVSRAIHVVLAVHKTCGTPASP
jgi:fumarate hydratase class II